MLLGNVGTYSGPVGYAVSGAVRGLRAWVRSVNDRGGLAGHPVQLFSADDGGDPAKNLALVKDMVENQHVIAFVSNMTITTTGASLNYLESKRVPVVGGDGVTPAWNQSVVMFPITTNIYSLFRAPVKLAVEKNTPKLGMLYCVEISACPDFHKTVKEYAPKVNATLVYAAQISLAQPDFTAECLQAQSNGAQAIILAADGNTAGRVARACHRQGYRPFLVTTSLGTTGEQADDPELEGYAAPQAVFPWILESSPATAEFAAAMRSYDPDVKVGPSTTIGWTAGKLMERIAAGLGDRPTSQQVFEGLWSLKDERLNGLTTPLTYTRDQGTPGSPCWFTVAVKDGKWTAPKGPELTCT